MFSLMFNPEFNQSRFPGHLVMKNENRARRCSIICVAPYEQKIAKNCINGNVWRKDPTVYSHSHSLAKKSLGKKATVTECENIGFQKPNSDLGWYFDGRPTTGCQMVLIWDRILASLSQLQRVRDIRDMS